MGLFSKKKDEDKNIKVRETSPAVSPTPEIQEEASQRGVAVPQTEDVSAYQVLREPHVTEKASLLGSQGTYVFKIDRKANKHQVKDAVQKLYKVSVISVRVIRIPAKKRRLGRNIGIHPGYKKALITLKKGDTIDVAV